MIINIRGTSGSGKSWVAKELLRRFLSVSYNPDIGGHFLNENTVLLGLYYNLPGEAHRFQRLTWADFETSLRRGGGVDDGPHNIRRPETLKNLVFKADGKGFHVILESLMVSGSYARWAGVAKQVDDFRWLFLNTPLEQCEDNVRARRAEAGNPRLFKPEATRSKYRAVASVLRKARADQMRVWEASSTEAVGLIAEWIGGET
jgi:hypothetical protein